MTNEHPTSDEFDQLARDGVDSNYLLERAVEALSAAEERIEELERKVDIYQRLADDVRLLENVMDERDAALEALCEIEDELIARYGDVEAQDIMETVSVGTNEDGDEV